MSGAYNPIRPPSAKPYRWKPKAKKESLKFTLIMDGAVRVYPDGREICQDNRAGQEEYKHRLNLMLRRQNWLCCLCRHEMNSYTATFEHRCPRGMAGARRDDRIEDESGKEMNGAAHWVCNGKKGSKRL